MSDDLRKTNLRSHMPSQSGGQDGRKNSFTTGQASKDSLTGKNSMKEYETGGLKKGALGGKNTNS